jgi:hypothetical protein
VRGRPRDFATQPALARLIGKPVCGVRVYKFSYATVGGHRDPEVFWQQGQVR